jgi:hypothetical protein
VRALLVASQIAEAGRGPADIAIEWTRRVSRQTLFSTGVAVDEAEVSVLVARFKVKPAAAEGSVASRLVDVLASLATDTRAATGGLILHVDELDTIATTEVASFLKILVERLALQGLPTSGSSSSDRTSLPSSTGRDMDRPRVSSGE